MPTEAKTAPFSRIPVTLTYVTRTPSTPLLDEVIRLLDGIVTRFGYPEHVQGVALTVIDRDHMDCPYAMRFDPSHPGRALKDSLYFPAFATYPARIVVASDTGLEGAMAHELGHHLFSGSLVEAAAEMFRSCFGPQDRHPPAGCFQAFDYMASSRKGAT